MVQVGRAYTFCFIGPHDKIYKVWADLFAIRRFSHSLGNKSELSFFISLLLEVDYRPEDAFVVVPESRYQPLFEGTTTTLIINCNDQKLNLGLPFLSDVCVKRATSSTVWFWTLELVVGMPKVIRLAKAVILGEIEEMNSFMVKVVERKCGQCDDEDRICCAFRNGLVHRVPFAMSISTDCCLMRRRTFFSKEDATAALSETIFI